MTQPDTPKPGDAAPDTPAEAELSAVVKIRTTAPPPADPAAPQSPLELRREMKAGYRVLREMQARNQRARAEQAAAQEQATAGALPAPEAPAPAPVATPAPNAALRGAVEIRLQTVVAQRLAAGRDAGGSRGARAKEPVIGLMTFAKQMRLLHQAARLDDPYADWFLLRVTSQGEDAKEEFTRLTAEVQALMTMPGLSVTVGETSMVFSVPLMFSTPHAFRGAYLLLELDRYARAVMTANHIGMIGRDEKHRRLDEGAHLCRRVFASASAYVYLELTRDDVRNGTRRAEQARKRMGVLPAEVLEQKVRDAFAPDVRRAPAPEVAKSLGSDLSGAYARRNARWADREAARAGTAEAGTDSAVQQDGAGTGGPAAGTEN